jgi:hypothetical protein
MDLTTYLENKIIDHVFRNTALTSPAAVYLALWNGDPGEAGTGGTEVTTTVRTAGRLEIEFDAPSSGVTQNTNEESFGASEGATTITHIAIMDAQSGGNMLINGALTGGSQSVAAGNEVKVNVGECDITFD